MEACPPKLLRRRGKGRGLRGFLGEGIESMSAVVSSSFYSLSSLIVFTTKYCRPSSFANSMYVKLI